jgi:hypothetical protein
MAPILAARGATRELQFAALFIILPPPAVLHKLADPQKVMPHLRVRKNLTAPA